MLLTVLIDDNFGKVFNVIWVTVICLTVTNQ